MVLRPYFGHISSSCTLLSWPKWVDSCNIGKSRHRAVDLTVSDLKSAQIDPSSCDVKWGFDELATRKGVPSVQIFKLLGINIHKESSHCSLNSSLYLEEAISLAWRENAHVRSGRMGASPHRRSYMGRRHRGHHLRYSEHYHHRGSPVLRYERPRSRNTDHPG